jgi:capsid protein
LVKAPRSGKASIAVRGFQAAQTDRLLSGWRSDIGFTPSEIAAHLETLRARCRQMAKDAPAFKRWLELSAINIVGEGFALKSTPHDGIPGSPQYRLDEAAARFIEWHWWRFCNYRDPETGLTWCDAGGRKTDSELDRLNVKTWKRDGEYFIHIVRTAANPYGIAWRVIRPDYCDHTYNVESTATGTVIHNGVEMDPSHAAPSGVLLQHDSAKRLRLERARHASHSHPGQRYHPRIHARGRGPAARDTARSRRTCQAQDA